MEQLSSVAGRWLIPPIRCSIMFDLKWPVFIWLRWVWCSCEKFPCQRFNVVPKKTTAGLYELLRNFISVLKIRIAQNIKQNQQNLAEIFFLCQYFLGIKKYLNKPAWKAWKHHCKTTVLTWHLNQQLYGVDYILFVKRHGFSIKRFTGFAFLYNLSIKCIPKSH